MAAVGTPREWTNAPLWRDSQAKIGTTEGDGDYRMTLRELIASPNSVYEVLEFLGRGTFGQVVKCWKKDSNEVVAMKVLKNTPSYAKQGQMEVDVLTKLCSFSAEEGNFVRAYESFQHRGHICIVFELLQINLYDYLKRTRFEPIPLKYIRPIVQQVLTCLDKLSILGLVHADLKPENIMLVDPDRLPFRIKVIDFGSAVSCDQTSPTSYLQSRYYRAPEVILGVPFNQAIDMWSLGCVLAELYLGWPLFPGASESEQITYICQTLGTPSPSLLRNRDKAGRFFNHDPVTSTWSLKSSAQLAREYGIRSKEARKYIFGSLLDMVHVGVDTSADRDTAYLTSIDRMEFVRLLSTMLTLDPAQRAHPRQALQMPFISMQHLAVHANTPIVWDWIQCMQVCRHPAPPPAVTPTMIYPHMQLLPGAILQPPPPHSNTIIPSSHLVCHVAPSTFGYLPIPPQPTAPTLQLPQPSRLTQTNWLDTRLLAAAAASTSTAAVAGGLLYTKPAQFHPSCTSAVLDQTNNAFTSKLLPVQLPSYHPFSRL